MFKLFLNAKKTTCNIQGNSTVSSALPSVVLLESWMEEEQLDLCKLEPDTWDCLEQVAGNTNKMGFIAKTKPMF